ncbi:MAG: hypothetical protein J5737_07915 [Bacteroidales bacterium]|nr:hypothetical protein [Bacteroidales bacterium]
MKRIPYLLAALLLAACSGTELPEPGLYSNLVPCTDPWHAPGQLCLDNMGIPGISTVTAGFDDTRTHLESGDSRVKVLWTSGDSFKEYWFNDNNQYGRATYTTAGSGTVADFTSNYTLPAGPRYYIYPCVSTHEENGSTYENLTDYNSNIVFDVEIPSEQTAVAGNVTDGTVISYSYAPEAGCDLTFHNFPALLRFRLSGSVVPTVTQVKLKGQSQVAGNVAINPKTVPAEFSHIAWSWDYSSNEINLSGSFVAGEEYYIAVIPSTQRIRLVFSDADGNTTTKVSGRDIEFKQGRVVDIGTVNLGSVLEDTVPQDPVLYMQATSGYKPVSIAVIPEAFKESESSDYDLLARSAVDAVMNTEPFKSYSNYFNVWILYAYSNESGASKTDGNGVITEKHDTYFGAQWGTDNNYSDMKADASTVYGFVQKNCPDILDGSHTIDEVPILMIINDDRYAGICSVSSAGRGFGMVPFAFNGGPLSWVHPSITAVSDSDPSAGTRDLTESELNDMHFNVGDWRNVAIHEFGGHCFSRLTDEYWGANVLPAASSISGHSWTVPFGLNVSASYSNPPWKAELLDELDNLLAINPVYSRIGVYQGAIYSPLNRWRSEKISCMIDNRAYFSTWQRVLIVKRIMSLAGVPFSMADFLSSDYPYDPVRDQVSAPVMGDVRNMAIPMVPPLPPPILQE